MTGHCCVLPTVGRVGDRWRCPCGRRWWCSSDPIPVACPGHPLTPGWSSALWQPCHPWWRPCRHTPLDEAERA